MKTCKESIKKDLNCLFGNLMKRFIVNHRERKQLELSARRLAEVESRNEVGIDLSEEELNLIERFFKIPAMTIWED